ncbi:MAG: iron-containing alcohol dehydrogenase [Actinobacteria bacterium]|nr:iron-containing alcohol dehydrogenase [Actinomycetota bacterium]
MIVRWSYAELGDVLAAAGIRRPVVIASKRWSQLDLPDHAGLWTEVPSARFEVPADADGVLAIGGGSAIDTGKYASAQSGLPVVHVPTTYSGAEWTTFYGIRTPDRRMLGGGADAHPVGLVYDVDLTLDLPPAESAGTALNALAHCAEALYVNGHNPEGDAQALAGAPLIARSLPLVLADGRDRAAREELLRGAMHAGHALALAGLALGHAMAQALGGTYGVSHGAMNALCLPPALAFNRAVVPGAVERFGTAIGAEPIQGARALAELGGFGCLRDYSIPEDELSDVAATASKRAGNRANPRPATPEEIAALYAEIW